jgi:hypothetical protein
MLGLVQARNLDINDVQVQVWSGAAPQAWPVLPWSGTALLTLGVTCLLVGLGFKYWQFAVREPGTLPARSCEPPREMQPSSEIIEYVESASAHDPSALAAPSQEARVLAALHHVLTVGLVVPTVLDEARVPRRRAAR